VPLHEFLEWCPGVTLERVRAVLAHAARSAVAVSQLRIFFYPGTPVPLRKYLTGHSVDTAFERGWVRLKSGELLHAAEVADFALLITTDQNLQYQQNLATRRIAVLVLTITSWPQIRAAVDRIVDVVNSLAPSGFAVVEIPERDAEQALLQSKALRYAV